jgi:hypothetical protein
VSHVLAFARFWWDFVVGEDWTVAAGVALGLGLTAILVGDDRDVWWLLPLAIAAVLAGSLWREARRQAAEQR